LASNSAGRLAGIQGIDSKKAIQLSEVSKLYLSEKDMVYLTESVKTSLKSSKYRIIDCGGKLKYYFGDVDSIALRKLETEDGKSILLVNLIRFFDLKMPLKVSKNKVRPSIKDDKLDSYVKKVINANIFKLQRAEREILDDLLSGGAIFQLLQERWRFSLRRTFLNKGLFLHRKDNIFRIRSTMITIPGNKVSSSENGLSSDSVVSLPGTGLKVRLEGAIEKVDFDVSYLKAERFQDLNFYGEWPLEIPTLGRLNPFLF